MVPSHAQRQSRSTWEMGMTVACKRCQSWSNTMAKGRMVSRRAPWKMKNASALYFELMDGVSENKEERGRERQKIERKVLRQLWHGIILFTCLFFPHSLFIWTCRCASACTHRKTLSLAKGLKKMKVNSSICPEAGVDSQIQWLCYMALIQSFHAHLWRVYYVHNLNTFGLTLSLWNTR